jgi:nucleoside-diphosphate-sugar epimerase
MAVRLIVGCGYLGSRVAARWQAAGDQVHVVSRSPDRARQWSEQGFHSHVADVTQPSTLQHLPPAETVLVAVGFDRRSGLAMRDVYVQGLAHLLAALPPDPGRLIYVSSTGVYGQSAGERVDEDSPCEPSREGGLASWEAEQRLLAHPLGRRSVRLRLAGLYGPGRIPFLAALAAGEPLATPADSLLNLIHVDDAADVVCWAAHAAPVPGLYVVSDGHPVVRREFYAEVARRIGAAVPRFVDPDAAASQAQRAAGGHKHVDSQRLWSAIGVPPRYPTHREGLAASLPSV